MTDTVRNLPPGAFMLRCPTGPKLVSQDPRTLTPEQIDRICRGDAIFKVDDFKLVERPDGVLEAVKSVDE